MLHTHTAKQLAWFLDSWLSFHAYRDGLPGLAVAIRAKDKLVYSSRVSSLHNLNGNEVYNIGSQSKMLTASIILQLAQAGQISIHEAAITFLPWLAEHSDRRVRHITIEQLLWHGAGLIRDGLDADYWQLLQPFPGQIALKHMVLSAKLIFDPGFKLKYSNIGYALLGQIAENATGSSYEALAKELIVAPLSLDQTHPSLPANRSIAPGYLPRYKDRWYTELPTQIPTRAFTPVTGWYSTPEDMSLFLNSVTKEDSPLLTKSWQEPLMYGNRHHWQSQRQRGSEYGLGMMEIETSRDTLLGHGGAFVTHRSATFTDPTNKVTVSIMALNKDAVVTEILLGIFEAIHYFEDHDGPIKDSWSRFAGTYCNMLATRYIAPTADGLVSVYLDDWSPFSGADQISPISENTFRITNTYDFLAEGEEVYFELKPAGTVKSIRYAGMTMWPEHDYVADQTAGINK